MLSVPRYKAVVAGPGLQGDRWQPGHNPTETETCAMYPTGKFGEAKLPGRRPIGCTVDVQAARAWLIFLLTTSAPAQIQANRAKDSSIFIDVPAPWRQCTWTWFGDMVIRHVLGPIPRGRLTCSPDLLSSEVLAFPHSCPLFFSIVTNNFTPSFLFEPHPMLWMITHHLSTKMVTRSL